MIMKYFKGRLTLILIMITGMLLGCSNENNNRLNGVSPNHATYTSMSIEFSSPDYYVSINDAVKNDDNYYVFTSWYPRVEDVDYCNKIYVYSEGLELEKEIQIDPQINVYVPCSIKGNQLKCCGYDNRLLTIDMENGEVIDSIEYEDDLCGVVNAEGGYVVLMVGRIEKYSDDGYLISAVDNNEWQLYNGTRTFYEMNGSSYLLSFSGCVWSYYKIDFDSHSSEKVYESDEDMGSVVCSGPYKFSNDGEYLLDFDSMEMYSLTTWNDTDLQPEKYGYADQKLIGVDNEEFIQLYSYDNGMGQFLVYTYDPQIDYSDRIPIKIGGYNIMNDIPFRWAIYCFNTSQEEYRAYIEDYSEQFGWIDTEEATAQSAALIQYFEDGNAPDIFYGQFFDYETLYSSGMTLDIAPYMDEEFEDHFYGITDNIRSLMINGEGQCYRVFSAYQIEGLVGDRELIDDNTDITIGELDQIAQENSLTPMSGFLSKDLAKWAIVYTLRDNGDYTTEEISEILEYSFEHGYQEYGLFPSVPMQRSSFEEYMLISSYGVYSPNIVSFMESESSTRLKMVGYPTIEGSTLPIVVFGQVAVSSGTSYPEACVDLISFLLEDDVQELDYMECFIPVEQKTLDYICDCCVNHSLISADDTALGYYIMNEEEISEEAVSDFWDMVYSINSVQKYDWGLESIIEEEIDSYYNSGKSVEEVAESLSSRINLYIEENYG